MTKKMRSISGVLLFTMVMALICSTAKPVKAGSAPSHFQPDSLQTIEKHYANQPFLLVLWSLDCPPCREELALLSKIIKRHPDFHLVLVSTDTTEASEQLGNVLASHQLDQIDSWVFSEAGAERLRYEIDPDWYGEIPRSYFYDQYHHKTGFSGSLKENQLESWLDAMKAPPAGKSTG